jgi:energy-converting hydrogenase Eha subunit G
MMELLQTAPTVLIVVLVVTTVVTLAGFGHLLWMWKKSGKK